MDKIRRKKKSKKSAYFLIFIIGFAVGIPIGLLISTQNLNVVTLDMIYSSEKRAWIEAIALKFKQWYKAETGQDILLNFRAMGSRGMVIAVETGEIKPTILSPASSIWIPFLNSRWLLGDIVNTSEVINPVYSPIVIGTWSNFNNSVGGIKNFADLQRISATLTGFHWAHTDPQLSNSGFMGVIMQVASYFGKNTSDLVFDDLTDGDMQTWMKSLESSILFYGKSTGFLAKKAISGDLDCFLVYENLVIEINKESLPDTALAIYPGNGTLLSDHPFAILDAPWVTPQERAAAEKFFEFLQLNSTIAEAFNEGFRPTDESILSNVTYNNTFNSIFNSANGVEYSLPENIYNPQMDATVLEYIPDLWIVTRVS